MPLWAGMLAIAAAMWTAYEWYLGILPLDPLMWRTLGGVGGHHTLIMFMITAAFFIVWKSTKLRPLIIGAGLCMAVSIHETIWWAVDILWYQLNGLHFQIVWLGGALEFVAVVTYFAWHRFGLPWPKRYFLAMLGFYVVWFAIGFPITVNYPGPTLFWTNGSVNAIEDISWLWAIAAYWIFEESHLEEWSRRSLEWLNITTESPLSQMLSFKKRKAVSVTRASVDLIIFATLGVAAITLLMSATTTTWGVVGLIAVTVTGLLFALSVATSFFSGKGRNL